MTERAPLEPPDLDAIRKRWGTATPTAATADIAALLAHIEAQDEELRLERELVLDLNTAALAQDARIAELEQENDWWKGERAEQAAKDPQILRQADTIAEQQSEVDRNLSALRIARDALRDDAPFGVRLSARSIVEHAIEHSAALSERPE